MQRNWNSVPCSDWFVEAMEMFSSQASTRLSFADAAMVAVARTCADGLILSFDEEFGNVIGLIVNPE